VPKNTRRQSVLAKLETTYGTDAVPVAGTDGVLLANPSIPDYKLVQEYVERQGLRAYHGAKEQIPTKKYATIALMQELAGFGTAGPASPTPGYDALLRACGLSRTITASTKVDYTPVSTAHESATVVWNADGLNHKITGARGSLKISMNNNEIPMLTYDLMGRYNAVTDVAFAAPTVTAYQRPQAVSPDNTSAFTLHGFGTACLQSFEFDMGYELSFRNLVQCTENAFPRDRVSKGKVTLEATTVAQKDWFAAVRAGTLAGFTITHGTTAGNKVVFSGSNVQLLNPVYGDDEENLMLTMDLLWVPGSAGNDEFTLSIQ
jgi:hypothetical protein